MIIDVHTHTPQRRDAGQALPPATSRVDRAPMRPDRADPQGMTWDDYLKAMEYVDRAIVFNIAAPPPGDERAEGGPVAGSVAFGQAREVNDQTAALVRAAPDKLIGFLSVHPRDPGMLDEIERAVHELGLRGIKLGPNYQNFDPLGEDAARLYQRAQELRLPILFHQGTSPVRFADLDYAHPRHIDRVATRFPELRIILAHLAHPWQIDAIAVIRKHPHVWADISALHYRPWSYYNSLRLATEWSVLHKLLFGSDYPVATPRETAEALPHINDILEGTKLPRVPLEELQQVVERDALDVLGLA
ncbi:MAG TPA: amidohydrolase family protein [Chloroflexota bacterium]|jgi:predicted TIM-barrel fold metal-dependent hydrolase|nr:amidohydrolase family protein [Chloroflexota bacterium]